MSAEPNPFDHPMQEGLAPDADGSRIDLLPGEARLLLDIEGYEGPLDLMLDLARRDKIDLRAISILALAEQYIAFIRQTQSLRLELAGDYLVMAAWLTYLKSRLMLPGPADSVAPAAEALAEDLAARLLRLEAIRKAGALLAERLDASRNRFARGAGEAVAVQRPLAWDVPLSDLLNAYMLRRLSQAQGRFTVAARVTLSIPEARAMLVRLIGQNADWCPIDILITAIAPTPAFTRSVRASTFAAALELAREGQIELRQEQSFAPLYLKAGARTAARAAS